MGTRLFLVFCGEAVISEQRRRLGIDMLCPLVSLSAQARFTAAVRERSPPSRSPASKTTK